MELVTRRVHFMGWKTSTRWTGVYTLTFLAHVLLDVTLQYVSFISPFLSLPYSALPATPCEHVFHYCPWHCGRLDSYLPSVGQRSACAISLHSLIESQVLEVQWYTNHIVSMPIDKDCRWRIGPPQSRWGHVDKGVTSGFGRYSVRGT